MCGFELGRTTNNRISIVATHAVLHVVKGCMHGEVGIDQTRTNQGKERSNKLDAQNTNVPVELMSSTTT